MILVIGARSKIGSALVDELVEHGEDVRALVRSGESAGFPSRVEVIEGDLADRASLTTAMAGGMANGLVELFADYRRSGDGGYAARVTDAVARLTGRPARSLDQLLTEQPVAST
jgi:uncharacterized protein YbjT (DUF2867 family)